MRGTLVLICVAGATQYILLPVTLLDGPAVDALVLAGFVVRIQTVLGTGVWLIPALGIANLLALESDWRSACYGKLVICQRSTPIIPSVN